MRSFDDRGQIYTIEGFASALILVGVLYFIFQSVAVVTPQTEKSADMKLSLIASDTLICLDRVTEDYGSSLKSDVGRWNGSSASYAASVNPGEPDIRALDTQIRGMLSADIGYRVDLAYYNGTALNTTPVIIHGVPGDNSVVAYRLVTLNDEDRLSPFWTASHRYPQVVEVRLTCWYL